MDANYYIHGKMWTEESLPTLFYFFKNDTVLRLVCYWNGNCIKKSALVQRKFFEQCLCLSQTNSQFISAIITTIFKIQF